mgnify:CR=1 FL=1
MERQRAIIAINIQDSHGNTAIHDALASWREDEQLERVKLLIKYACGFDFTLRNKNGYTVLHSAALRGPAFLEPFLDKTGVDVNCRAKFGRAPPILVTIYFCGESISVLLINRANVHQRDNEGKTA